MMKALFLATLIGFLGGREVALAAKVMSAMAALLGVRILLTVFAAFLPLLVLTQAIAPGAGISAGRHGDRAA
jgi:hypothetical protein